MSQQQQWPPEVQPCASHESIQVLTAVVGGIRVVWWRLMDMWIDSLLTKIAYSNTWVFDLQSENSVLDSGLLSVQRNASRLIIALIVCDDLSGRSCAAHVCWLGHHWPPLVLLLAESGVLLLIVLHAMGVQVRSCSPHPTPVLIGALV